MHRFLITGGAGFIGSSLASRLSQDKKNHIVIVDDLSTGFEKNIDKKPNIAFIKCDVNNTHETSRVFEDFEFDYVFHYAAVVGVKRTLDNPLKVLDDIEGFKNILSLSKKHNIRRVLFASSSEVYGEPVEIPLHEERSPLNAKLPYAIVKNVGESYLKSYRTEYGLPYTIFRFFNTYGPRQNTDFVMAKFISKALKNEDIPVYGDGMQSRTFCYIDDNLDATLEALNSESAEGETYNIGSDIKVSIIELAETVIRATGSRSKIVHKEPLKEGDMTRREPDVTKMKQLLKREFTPLSEGIDKVLRSLR